MFDPGQLAPEDRRHFFRRAAIAPLCLCAVAALQLTRVVWCNQTPWKGGGFGMFSTVDAESARFLRCYLITPEGDLPLPVPEALHKRQAELRAAPTHAAAADLAERLAGQRWRWRDERQRRELAQLRPAGTSGAPTALGTEHVLEPIPRTEAGLEAIAFSAVRVECWRYRFHSASAELRAEKLLEVIHPRQEAVR
jgi:hypothetical protein